MSVPSVGPSQTTDVADPRRKLATTGITSKHIVLLLGMVLMAAGLGVGGWQLWLLLNASLGTSMPVYAIVAIELVLGCLASGCLLHVYNHFRKRIEENRLNHMVQTCYGFEQSKVQLLPYGTRLDLKLPLKPQAPGQAVNGNESADSLTESDSEVSSSSAAVEDTQLLTPPALENLLNQLPNLVFITMQSDDLDDLPSQVPNSVLAINVIPSEKIAEGTYLLIPNSKLEDGNIQAMKKKDDFNEAQRVGIAKQGMELWYSACKSVDFPCKLQGATK